MAVDFSKSHEAMDVEEHRRTYGNFVKWSVILTVHVLVLLALMAAFLV